MLKSVIKLANLVEKTEGTIHYLYTKGEIDEDAEFIKREKIMTRVYRLNYVRSDELLQHDPAVPEHRRRPEAGRRHALVSIRHRRVGNVRFRRRRSGIGQRRRSKLAPTPAAPPTRVPPAAAPRWAAISPRPAETRCPTATC